MFVDYARVFDNVRHKELFEIISGLDLFAKPNGKSRKYTPSKPPSYEDKI